MPRKPKESKAVQPAIHIDEWPVSRLRPYEKNPRKNDKAVDQMRASIREFGFAVPCLAKSDGELIDGHLRLKAAIAEGLEKVPVIPCDGWSDTQVKAFRLMVNRSVGWADWDAELLAVEFAHLQSVGFDLALTGFDIREIDAFTLKPSADEDMIPDVPIVAFSKLGDLWRLGDHRLLCGDSTDADSVARLMQGKKASLFATDPPYLVDYKGGNHPRSWANAPDTKDKHWDDYTDPAPAVKFYVDFLTIGLQHCIERVPVYQWHADRRTVVVVQAFEQAGLLLHQIIVWQKGRPVLTRSHYMWQHEPCAYGWPKGKVPRKPPANSHSIWTIDQKGESDGIHPTQKPVELARRPILYHTGPCDICYEPFSGSGTTLVAAELTGRLCYGIEISPAFVDVIITRWQTLTGKQAILDGDWRTFAAIAIERKDLAAKP